MDCLNCVNCKVPVTEQQAKFFASVFLCPTCYERAERFYRRSEGELKMLLLVLKERIRTDLIGGRFFAGEAEKSPEEVSKTDLFRMMVRLEQQREASRQDTAPNLPPSKRSQQG